MTDQIPGYREISRWPIPPKKPFKILSISLIRDGTVTVTLNGKNGRDIKFFFDSFLGRLCYGEDEKNPEAAYIQKNSAFERESFGAIQQALNQCDIGFPFSRSDIVMLQAAINKAKVYSGL